MRWWLVCHIVSMVAWFAGLFYLPRLFVYHANAHDQISLERFKVMEKKLYYMITTPAGVLTTVFGLILLSMHWSFFLAQGWMQLKLLLVALLWCFHVSCGYYVHRFKTDTSVASSGFFRWYNEIPSILLIAIIILAIIQP